MSFKNLFKSLPLVNHSLAYNPSIDGLRGVAVLLVVIFHIWHEAFSFGYVGVDIFFVLSGFLITQIIYQKISRNAFSLKEFYRNRIRRIFPAVILTLLAAMIVGNFFMLISEYNNLGKHIKSSALFYENFRLIGEVGYWDKDASLKPLLHFWSLAIEEQFYIFWPFVLIILFYAKNNFNIKISISLSLICALLFILPFFLEINKFYHLLSRSYELAFGSLAFVLAKEYKKLRAYLHIYKKFIYIFFVIAILASINNTEYNAFKTLLISLASCALIISLNREKQSRVFANSPLVFLGLISFPLYLNHYAIISFCHILGIDISAWRGVLVLIICVFLAFLVYRFIELYARAQKSYVFAGILLAIMLAAGFGGKAIQKDKGNIVSQRSFINTLPFAWPKELKEYEQNAVIFKELLNTDPLAFIYTNKSDLGKEYTLILGDSHARDAFFNISASKESGHNLMLGIGDCPALMREYEMFPTCKIIVDKEYELLNKINIKELFIFNYMNDSRLKNPALYKSKMREIFAFLSQQNYPVYFVIDVPTLPFFPSSCIGRSFGLFSRYESCKITREYYEQSVKIYKQIINSLAKEFPKINVIDPVNALCDKKFCYAFDGVKPLYGDNHHLNVEGGKRLFNELKKHIKDL